MEYIAPTRPKISSRGGHELNRFFSSSVASVSIPEHF